jgi:hypothetical protein
MPTTLIEVEKIEFMLGEQIYTCPALGSQMSREWRKKFSEEVGFIFSLLNDQKALLGEFGLGDVKDLASLEIAQLLPVLGEVFQQINHSFDSIPALVESYSPQFSFDIVSQASNAQLLYALSEMARIEFINPFQAIFSRRSGPVATSTSKSSPSPNGESGPVSLPDLESEPLSD